jgi:membrane protease YdiL (CAAX protease family)
MQEKNPFEGIRTYDRYSSVWKLTAFILFVQVLMFVLVEVAGNLSGFKFDTYEAAIPVFIVTAYVSWKVLAGLGVSWRAAWTDWQANARADLLKAFKYYAGYAGLILAMILALGSAYYFWGDALAALMKPVAASSAEQELSMKTQSVSAIRFFLLLLSACAVAPVVEEVFFRRIVYTTLRVKRGFWFSAFWSGLLFALFHGGAAPVTFPVGIYLCWVYERERRLPVNIMLHAMINFSATLYKTFY